MVLSQWHCKLCSVKFCMLQSCHVPSALLLQVLMLSKESLTSSHLGL